ncbi:MAG: Gfo/Idh/MocA family oxidoreductase [Sedimentisphaerales bacterium]|nr:Gfo/Idh/MocA family oxidoreductase [Sedimentisphaerales bacterium]
MESTITRRSFMEGLAGAAIAFPFVSRCWGQPPNSKLHHACIGVGGMGNSDLHSIVRGGKVQVIAICDIDENNLNAAAKILAEQYNQPDVRKYRDWRDLLEKEAANIDSVNVTTPDHMHAPITMSAIQKGKHVYCQKPLTHTVLEARRITQAARKAGVVTQMGIQIHSDIAYRMAVRIVQNGTLGKIKEWHSWKDGGPFATGGRPEGSDPVPPTVDWDKWIGVASMRPYKEKIYHPFAWRGWLDFGSGMMGDFTCHIFDPPFTAMGLSHCLSVKTEVPHEEWNGENYPSWQIHEFLFPGTKYTEGKTIKGTWYSGGKRPPDGLVEMPPERKLPGAGSMFIGTEGVMVLPHWAGPQLYPMDKFKGYKRPDVKSLDHYQEWVDACMGNGKTDAGFDYSGPLTETTQLGNLSIRYPGKMLEWDASNLRFTNAPEANRYIHKKYRDGWSVKGLG